MTTYEFDCKLVRQQGDDFDTDEPLIVSWLPAGDLDLAGETQRIMGMMTGSYTDQYVKAVDNFIRAMEAIDRWESFDFFHFYQAANEYDALINWRGNYWRPTNLCAAFSPYLGFTASSGGNVINTNANPTNADLYRSQDAMFGFYASTDPDTTGKIDMGVKDSVSGSDAHFSIDTGSGRINGVQDVTATLNKERGLYLIERSGDQTNDVAVYEDNVDLGASAAGVLATANLPDFNLYVGGVNNEGVVEDETSRLYAASFMGSTMSGSDYTVFYNALEQLIQATRLYNAPTISSFSPSTGQSPDLVTITGTNFVGATAVKFGVDDAMSFRINSDTEISAVVPSLADGPYTISVTTPGGTANSSTDFDYFAGGGAA